ncbi:MAG: hypothetical protein AAGG01_22765, partial [Planctomycetota bacterium]
VRALREDDELRALRGVPTPQGLQLVERAAGDAGASMETIARLREATAAYASMLSEFSGGRNDLEATLAGWIPEERDRAERDARRSVFRGMTTLSGTRTGTIYNSLYLVPSPDSRERIDSLLVAVRQDVRRLQAGARILVMQITTETTAGVWGQERRTLEGSAIEGDPRTLLLPDLCSHPIPALDLDTSTAERLAVRIAEDALDVNEFATLGFGWRTVEHFPRRRNQDVGYGQITMRAVHPAEALVMDLFVHEDVQLGGSPFTAIQLADQTTITVRRSPPAEDSTARTSAPPVLHLDAHPSGLHSQDVRACKAIAENACREAGYAPENFRKYRTRLEFPVLSEELTLWWPLAH